MEVSLEQVIQNLEWLENAVYKAGASQFLRLPRFQNADDLYDSTYYDSTLEILEVVRDSLLEFKFYALCHDAPFSVPIEVIKLLDSTAYSLSVHRKELIGWHTETLIKQDLDYYLRHWEIMDSVFDQTETS